MKTNAILTRGIATLFALAPFAAHGAADTLTGTGGATQPGVSWAPTTAAGGTIGVWSLGAIPGAGDNAIIAATGLIDVRGSAAAFNPSATVGTTEIQDLTFNSTAAVTLNNNTTSRDMVLILNGGRGAGVPLISTIGDFAYTIQGAGSNGTTPRPLRLQLNASGGIDVTANALSISAVITESGGARSLSKTGAGRLVLSGANTFTGGIALSAGILRATGNAGALGTGTLTLAGGELQLANDAATAFNRNTVVTANAQITSDRAAAGAGVTHTLGTLAIGAQTLTIAPGALSTSGTAGVTFGATTLSGAAIFSVATGAALTLGATDVGANPLTASGPGTMTISGAISAGAGGLVRGGAGRVILAGASTFTTGATLLEGVTEVTNNDALGTGAIAINSGATLEVNLAGANLRAASITANPGGRVAVRGLTLNSAVTLAGGILGTRTNDLGTFAGPVNVAANSSVELINYTAPANNQSIIISGKLSGANTLNVVGGATANAGAKALILTDTANDFSGVFNVASGQRLSSIPAATTGSTLGTASVNLSGGFLRLNDNGVGVDGTLAYGNNLTVGGASTIDLDRVNGANSGNTFVLGTLTAGSGTLTINGANGYKASFTGGTLNGSATINHAGAVAITGAIGGFFGLNKTGAGTLTLGGANTYLGTTTVSVGGLNLTGSLAGVLALGANTTLSGAGTVLAGTSVANGAVLNPGNANAGTFTTGALTFGAADADLATVNFTTGAVPGNINVTAANGLAAFGAAGSVGLKLLTTLPALGTHTVIDYSGAIGGTGFSAFTLAPLPNPRIVATLANNLAATRIELTVTAVDAPRWSGALSGEWSTAILGTPKNWSLIIGVGTTDFISGDNALFDDAAAGGVRDIVLNVENVAPDSVVFDNSFAVPYTLSGTNAIAGTTGLTKTRNGTLTISNTNSFTGPVSISAGTISVNAVANSAANSPLGAGAIVNISNGGTLDFTGATGSTNRALNVGAGGGTVRIPAASTLTQAGAITAAGLFTLENAGTATLSGAIGGAAGVVVNTSGTTSISGNVATALTLNGAGSSAISGNITIASVLTKNGSATTTLTGAANNPVSTTIAAGILQIGDGVASGSIGNGVITNNAILAFNNPAAVTAGGAIGGTGILTKTGAGITTLSGAAANTFTGTTTVSGGNLVLAKTSGVDAIGGNLVIETGGTVSYSATAGQFADHIPNTATITINGGTFGSGVGATLAAPTTGVMDTVGNVTVNSGTFLSGRGPGATPAPFVVLGDFKVLGGNALVQRGGALTATSVQLTAPAVLDLDGGSGTANNQSRLNVGGDGLALTGATINLNAGPSTVNAASLGSIVTLGGNVISTGTSSIARLNPTLSNAFVDLAAATRTFDVAGALTIAPAVRNGGLLKTNAGTLTLTGVNTHADGTTITGGILNANADAALGAAAGPVTISGGAVLQAGGAISTTARTVTLGAGGGRIDTNGNAVTLGIGSTVTGTSLTKVGTGTLTLAGTQTYDTLTTSAGRTDLTSALGTGTSTINSNAETNTSVSQTLTALNIGDGAVFSLGALPPAPAPGLAFEPAFANFEAAVSSAAAVPEPGATALLLGAVVMFFGRLPRSDLR